MKRISFFHEDKLFLAVLGISDKKRPKISCNPFIYYSFGQKTF